MDEIDTATGTEHALGKASLRVVETVARADGVDPADLEPPLYDVIDPGALDLLFDSNAPDAGGGRISFEYRGYDVTIHSNGQIELA